MTTSRKQIRQMLLPSMDVVEHQERGGWLIPIRGREAQGFTPIDIRRGNSAIGHIMPLMLKHLLRIDPVAIGRAGTQSADMHHMACICTFHAVGRIEIPGAHLTVIVRSIIRSDLHPSHTGCGSLPDEGSLCLLHILQIGAIKQFDLRVSTKTHT